jgi:hypothetical protein
MFKILCDPPARCYVGRGCTRWDEGWIMTASAMFDCSSTEPKSEPVQAWRSALLGGLRIRPLAGCGGFSRSQRGEIPAAGRSLGGVSYSWRSIRRGASGAVRRKPQIRISRDSVGVAILLRDAEHTHRPSHSVHVGQLFGRPTRPLPSPGNQTMLLASARRAFAHLEPVVERPRRNPKSC